MGYTGGSGGYYIPPAYKPPTPPPRGRSRGVNIIDQALDRTSYGPSDPRSPDYWRTIDPGTARSMAGTDPYGYVRQSQDWQNALANANPFGNTQPMFNRQPSSGRSGGGGGGGGGGPTGIDQSTLDWIMARLSAQPGLVTYRDLDMPDPSQFMHWDSSMFDQAGQGVNQGIQGIRDRGYQAFDQAGTELAQYANPYTAGGWAKNPDIASQMQQMAQANDAVTSLQGVAGEGVQADAAFGNVNALMAAADQARSAANRRALAGDRRTFDTSLGLEGNLLNLGVNMAKARSKNQFDQSLQAAMLQAAQQEAMQNYTRQNEVETTNMQARNQWMQDTLGQFLSLIGNLAPGVTLPGDMSWFQAVGPGVDVSGGFNQPVTA